MTPSNIQVLEALGSSIGALAKLKAEEEERKKWRNIARPSQLPPPGDYVHWVALCGRSWGKTRVAAEYHKEEVLAGRAKRAAIIAPTAADLRDVMVEGESGILGVWANDPSAGIPVYEKTNRRVIFPNGSKAFLYSAEEPQRLRGPQHDFYIFDEPVAAPRHQQTWDMLQFGLRLGKKPHGIVTSTPMPLPFIKELRNSPYASVTHGTTYENRANLPPAYFDQIINKYEGTRLGRQELLAEILEEVPDALWRESTLKTCWVDKVPCALRRIVIALDPSVTDAEENNETGIIAAGEGEDGHGYVLWDGSLHGRPEQWAAEAVRLYHWLQADGIIAEKNQGGDMIESVLRAVDANIPFRAIHASRAKHVRAEPVAALYERAKVHHVRNVNGEDSDLRALESQYLLMSMSMKYTGRGSPDRCDAAVHALTDLLLLPGTGTVRYLPEFHSTAPAAGGNAQHISSELIEQLPYWLHRWISVNLGPVSTAHWYAQDGEQVKIYRELMLANVGVEEFGHAVAQESEQDLEGVKNMFLWLTKEHFNAGLTNKSVAQALSDGLDRSLGRGGTFINAFTDAECHIADPARRMFELKRRKEAEKMRRISILSVDADPMAGWEHLRALLTVKTGPELVWDADYAKHLKETDRDKYNQYVNTVAGSEIPAGPKLMILSSCPLTIRALNSLSRDRDKPTLPALIGENGALAESVLLGMLAHREHAAREPFDEFLARRLENVRRRRGNLTPDIQFQVEQKARGDYQAMQAPAHVDLRILPQRKRA